MSLRTFLIVADGAGDYRDLYNAILVKAESAQDAAEWVTAPKQGYGARTNGSILVIAVEDVTAFKINPTNALTLTPEHPSDVLGYADDRIIPVSS